ncbi:MAG: hypothetical protein GWO20_06590 [Candidatus Korarchaeota archaeon]|nr:hypothetical protein [Candidatus Korarchaeota archaeon]
MHATKDILHVKERLRHKSITNTLIYTHLVDFGDACMHKFDPKGLRVELLGK